MCHHISQHENNSQGHKYNAILFLTYQHTKMDPPNCYLKKHGLEGLSLCRLDILKWVLWQTVKTQMKCCMMFRGQKYLNIALVLQDERLTTFTRPANTCTCPLKAYAIKNIRVICNMTSSSNSFQSIRLTERVLLEELLVLSRFHS